MPGKPGGRKRGGVNEGGTMDPTRKTEKKIITDRQARALLDLMRVFYENPKNRAAYEAWKKAREARGVG